MIEDIIIMSSRNIIPDKIPPKIWKNRMGDIDDIILYALNSYSPMSRVEFISDDNTKRMNKNTFHKYAKELKKQDYIDSYREGKNSFYTILPLGENELSRRLIKYNLDFDTIVELENKKNKNLVNKFSKFFRDNEIEDPDIQLEYLKLVSVITQDKLSEIYSKEEFNKLILYLTLNHPRFYPNYTINKEDFIEKYNQISEGKLSTNFINTFIELVVDKKKYGINFHKLNIETAGINLYFTENSEYGELFKLIVDNRLKDLIFLKNLGVIELNYLELQDTYDRIIKCLTEDFKLFHPKLAKSMYQLIDNYRDTIKQKIIKRVTDDLIEYTVLSILPERDTKQKLLQLTKRRKSEKLSEIKLLMEIGRFDDVKSLLKELLSQDYDDDLLFKLTDLAADLIQNNKYNMAEMIFKESSKLGKENDDKFHSLFEEFYLSKVYEEQSKENYEVVLKLIESYENYFDDYGDIELLIIENKIYTLMGLGRFNEALTILDNNLKNWEKYGVYIEGELFPEGYSEALFNKENYKKSIYYTFGILKSQILMKMGEYQESLNVLKIIFELDIQTSRLFSLKAMNEINLEMYEEAMNTTDQGLKIEHDNLKLNQIKANALFKLRRYNDALDIINYIIELDPHFEDTESSKNLVLKAWVLFYKDDLNDALKVVNDAYKKFPDLPGLYEIGSLIYDLKGEYGEALDLIEQAEEKGGIIIPYNKAQLLKNIKKYPEALDTINSAIKDSPNDPSNYQMKATILAEMERYNEALEQIEKSINLSFEGDQGLNSIKEQILQRKALFIANKGKKGEAIDIIKEAIEFNPKWASESYHVYGEILMIFNDYSKAIEQFEMAKTLPFTPIDTYIKLGKCYLEFDNVKEALVNLEKGKYEAQHRVKKMVLTKEGKEIEQDFPQMELIEEAELYIEEANSSTFYVFILELVSKDGTKSYYTGYTNSLYRRWHELREKPPKEYTKHIKLKYFEVFPARTRAVSRSREIDKLSEQKKEELIKSIAIDVND